MRVLRSAKNGDSLDATETMYPCRLEVVSGKRRVGSSTSSSYGYVLSGSAKLTAPRFELKTEAGAFVAVAGELEIEADGIVVVIERYGFRTTLAAGRIETEGRLAYIDGCSDTVLCAPPRSGDPVLNFLHFPAHIEQSLHAHPSVRLGVVARGGGTAFGPGRWEEPLEEGCAFLIGAHEVHAFTTSSDRAMDIIAFHPDSDWGPTDGAHPMLNRTYLARSTPSRRS